MYIRFTEQGVTRLFLSVLRLNLISCRDFPLLSPYEYILPDPFVCEAFQKLFPVVRLVHTYGDYFWAA